MGWIRAILTAAVIAAVGIAVLVFGPNTVLTKVHSLNRGNQVGIATSIFFLGLLVLAWALRRLQHHDLI